MIPNCFNKAFTPSSFFNVTKDDGLQPKKTVQNCLCGKLMHLWKYTGPHAVRSRGGSAFTRKAHSPRQRKTGQIRMLWAHPQDRTSGKEEAASGRTRKKRATLLSARFFFKVVSRSVRLLRPSVLFCPCACSGAHAVRFPGRQSRNDSVNRSR